jgi:hypothetical protein
MPAMILAFAVVAGSAFYWCVAEPPPEPESSDLSTPSSQQAACCPGEQIPEAIAKPEPADNSYCYACHVNYEEEKLTRVHERVGVGCESCHGPSIEHSGDEDNLIPPDKMFPKSEINAFCMTCHEKENLLKRANHCDFFKKENSEETCSKCHGKKHRLKVRTRVWDKQTRELLEDDGVRMMEKQPK